MFDSTKSKLQDCRIILGQLEAVEDALTFQALFSSFLSSSRAVTYALQKEGAHIPGFGEWYKAKRKEMRNDELLRFVHEARTEDFHEGKHRLKFGHTIESFDTKRAIPPSANARMQITTAGPLWLVDEGTPQEQRIPIKKGGTWTIHVSITNPPTEHLGCKLERYTPMTICQLALDYYAKLVHEANIRFTSR